VSRQAAVRRIVRWGTAVLALGLLSAIGAGVRPAEAPAQTVMADTTLGLRSPAVPATSPWSPTPVADTLICDSPRLRAALDTLALLGGTTPESFRVDPAALALVGEPVGRLRFQRYVMDAPGRAPATLEGAARELARAGSVARVMMLLADLGEPEVSVAPLPDTVLAAEERAVGASSTPVTEAMEALFDGTGKRFQGRDRETVDRDAATLAPGAARELAALILACRTAAVRRNREVDRSELERGGIFGSKGRRTAAALRGVVVQGGETADGDAAEFERELSSLDLRALTRGAVRLAGEVDTAAAALAAVPTSASDFQFDWNSPLGRVAVGGTGSNRYHGSYLLVLDLGGDDVYEGPGSASGDDPASVVVDLGGNDRYAPADSGRAGPGGAILGYAAVVDLGAGNDEYTTTAWGAGFGFGGVGWIEDDGGDDSYQGQWLSQGSAICGMGILCDRGGNDRFEITGEEPAYGLGTGQGFGGWKGLGLLLDLGGRDRYRAEARKESPWGGRDDTTEIAVQGAAAAIGPFPAAGLGLLVDAGGDDTYEAGYGVQGFGRDFGLGALVDLAGRDTCLARAHGLGCGERMGAGILVNLAGADLYLADRGLGFGDDLGLGMFLDAEGPDTYDPGWVSLGASFRQGAGWFVDLAGENGCGPCHENELNRSIGFVDSRGGDLWRRRAPGVAVFVDISGAFGSGDRLSDLARKLAGGRYAPPRGFGERRGGIYCDRGPAPGGTDSRAAPSEQ
jgi:hypothetical protein